MFVSDFNSLFNLPGPIAVGEYILGGYFSEGDGGGGTFVWIIPGSGGTLPDEDLGIIIYNLNDSNGYFKRIYSGPINVQWFGAILGQTDTNPPLNPYTGMPYIQPIADVTPYVHRARDSFKFNSNNNGTLYFPRGEYPGAFEFTYIGGPNDPKAKNEISIFGDGQGTILKSNGTSVNGVNNPVLRLGVRNPHWEWAKVSNLKIDGTYGNKKQFSDGVILDNPLIPFWGTEVSGRWVFERVIFTNCYRGVFKPNGNIGNHFIDCYWRNNNYGVYAECFFESPTKKMESGCDKFDKGMFGGNSSAAIQYSDFINPAGQIIIDGTIFEDNPNWAIVFSHSQNARMTWNGICIRNVWFEQNGNDQGGGDMLIVGVRSVRIEDSRFRGLTLMESSVSLFNCRYNEGIEGNFIHVDKRSSLVAYEQRYDGYPTDKIFINSISYDGTQEYNNEFWTPTSVWGPLRNVKSTILNPYLLSYQFDTVTEPFVDPVTNLFIVNTILTPQMHVLGNGSGWLIMEKNWKIRSKRIIATINEPSYCVWSIHTYLQSDIPEDKIKGQIVSENGFILGWVYFKKNQWACSYGMKFLEFTGEPLKIRLDFTTTDYEANFFITDYQILTFEDLASANSFVNSKIFAIPAERVDELN